ncbi:protein phosphatase 1 regulatory subunit 12B-like [Cynoglossus semilaevis]|uniref:Protein phosphatase 1 regulatory subunit 12B-like n=1 Tax=Cynoglossus semilaevis TaxID=244447 RepID=A0A3P8WFS1_CYNSE|nr:protein phosphatase 1 regulatory subunit 12B-like [Cynoglossus semilaevis]
MSSVLSHNKDQPASRKTLSDSALPPTSASTRSLRHERLSRLSSSGPGEVFTADTKTNHAESYFKRRENRLSSRKKAEEETENDYKKMYEKAVATNQRLKSRLETSKQELVMIQDQLQRTQKGRVKDSDSTMLEAEKLESWSLKKRITDMEEQLKIKSELKMENQRLKDENGALIRVITKLSK